MNSEPIENPEPGTRNPEPGTRNPEPGTRNPEPGTRNPKQLPADFNQQFSILHRHRFHKGDGGFFDWRLAFERD